MRTWAYDYWTRERATELQERANRMEQALKVILVWAGEASKTYPYTLIDTWCKRIEDKCREALAREE